MKDLNATNFIMVMKIKKDGESRKISFNKMKYIEIILKHFKMHDFKLVKVTIPVGARIIVEECPRTQEEI